jgi:hypothetical protein
MEHGDITDGRSTFEVTNHLAGNLGNFRGRIWAHPKALSGFGRRVLESRNWQSCLLKSLNESFGSRGQRAGGHHVAGAQIPQCIPRLAIAYGMGCGIEKVFDVIKSGALAPKAIVKIEYRVEVGSGDCHSHIRPSSNSGAAHPAEHMAKHASVSWQVSDGRHCRSGLKGYLLRKVITDGPSQGCSALGRHVPGRHQFGNSR